MILFGKRNGFFERQVEKAVLVCVEIPQKNAAPFKHDSAEVPDRITAFQVKPSGVFQIQLILFKQRSR